MDTTLLMKWLGLPPGEWPPAPHILLGVNAGATTAIQDRALAQMEKLRPHQLMNLELVTEGMKRLAQALIALEEAAKPKRTPLAESVDELAFKLNLEFIAPPPIPAVSANLASANTALQPAVVPPALPTTLARRKKRKRKAIPVLPTIPAVAVEVPPPGLTITNRRRSYRRLVQVRKELRSWERLGPFFGIPSRMPSFSAEIYQFLQALHDARMTLTDDHFRGLLIVDLVRQGVPISVFRSLLDSQRQQLASEWATGFAELQGQHQAMRLALRASKPQPTPYRRMKTMGKWFDQHPEWKIVLPLILAAVIVAIRLAKSQATDSGH